MVDFNQRLVAAQSSLKLKDVFARKIYAQIDDNYHPFDGADDALVVQTKIQTTHHHVLERRDQSSEQPGGDEQPEKKQHCEFKVLAAARFVDPDNQDERVGEVVVLFSAVYAMTAEVDSDVLVAFGLKNAPFHVWPYWRELLHSAAGRLRLPSAVLPMYHYDAGVPSQASGDSDNSSSDTWQVDVNELYDMMFWTSAYSIQEPEFRKIVATVGPDTKDLVNYFKEQGAVITNEV